MILAEIAELFIYCVASQQPSKQDAGFVWDEELGESGTISRS